MRNTHPLKFTLTLCAIAGCVQPLSWTSSKKQRIYAVHRLLLISVIFTLMTSQLINIILNIDKSNEYSDTMYMTLAVLIGNYKLISMWITAKNIRSVIDIFAEKLFRSLESYETIIQQKYTKLTKKYAMWYYMLVQITVVGIIVNAYFTNFTKRNLTYRAWLPFDYTSPGIFFLVFTHQMLGVSIVAAANVACDLLVSGLMQQICCQLEILEYRLTKFSKGQYILRDCVRHHDRIYEYAHKVNIRFAHLIAFQFAVSMLVVCANLYKLATTSLNSSLFIIVLYTACMLSQIFLYCWFGNELKLKSLELASNIYKLEWQKLNNNSKKDLVLIMRRTSTPIEFNSAIIITLNLESFMSLLKTSYSIYNVLKYT
ncbi:odorant receptor 46a-like [Pseudomyrmex gracilis]|uniref:odorant receptor 46a-like n=1 Tax=Pseudomyrmex gracilis TaxID=219809 RepID=UPI00099496A0|nr:odorant receptor 46a-like [Pseudomyrmex gracilis]